MAKQKQIRPKIKLTIPREIQKVIKSFVGRQGEQKNLFVICQSLKLTAKSVHLLSKNSFKTSKKFFAFFYKNLQFRFLFFVNRKIKINKYKIATLAKNYLALLFSTRPITQKKSE